MRKSLIIILTLVTLAFAGTLVYTALPHKTLPLNKSRASVAVVTINNIIIEAEIADTLEKQTKGLSGRESLMENYGMLFDFTQNQNKQPSFWMKDMQFNIDIIWIKNNTIIKIEHNVPAPSNNQTLPTYSPGQDIDYVLEVNAGFSAEHNLKTGDQVIIKKN